MGPRHPVILLSNLIVLLGGAFSTHWPMKSRQRGNLTFGYRGNASIVSQGLRSNRIFLILCRIVSLKESGHPTSQISLYKAHYARLYGTFGNIGHFNIQLQAWSLKLSHKAITVLSLRLALVYRVQYHVFGLFTTSLLSNNDDGLLSIATGGLRDLNVTSTLPSNGVNRATASTDNMTV